jgi:peptide/nickel transport system substrate-binding protein
MRRLLLLACLSLATLAALACGGASAPGAGSGTPAAGSAPAAGQPPAPAEMKDLIVGIPADTTNVQGDRATLAMSSPNANVYETLARMTPDFQVQPWLAERWEFVEPNTWRFYLRKDVTFHDGSKMTAQDVVWTLERTARAGGRSINAGEGGAKAVDDATVEFTPNRPNRKVPLQIVHPNFGIMKAGSDPVNAPVGTGPFRLVEYRAKEFLKVERYEGYWDKPNAATVKSVTFRYIPDNNARVLALKAGDVDIITQAPRESVADIKRDAKLKVVLTPVGAYQALSVTVNGQGEWSTTADRRVREAIAKGIDRDGIVKQVWEGNAELGRSLPPPAILGAANKDKVQGGPRYDPDGARRILDEAGWRPGSDGIRVKDGRRLEIVLVNGFPEPETHRPIPEVIQQQLRRIGIDLKIVETNSYDDSLKEGKGHLWLERGNQNDANPAFLPNLLYVSLQGGNRAGEDYARLFGIGAKVDEPMAQAQATADIPKTQELSAQALRVLIDEEFVVIPIAGLYNITATSNRIEGFNPHSALIHTDFRTVIKR